MSMSKSGIYTNMQTFHSITEISKSKTTAWTHTVGSQLYI